MLSTFCSRFSSKPVSILVDLTVMRYYATTCDNKLLLIYERSEQPNHIFSHNFNKNVNLKQC